MKTCGLPVLLSLGGLGFLLWAMLDFTLQGYTSAAFGGILPGLALIAAGVGVFLWNRPGGKGGEGNK